MSDDMDMDESVYDGDSPDAQAYLNEMRKAAMDVLFPSPEEMKARMPFIIHLKGKHPNLYVLYQAACEWEVLDAMENGRPIQLPNPATFIMANSPSLGGERANQAVEIARAAPKETGKRGFLSAIREMLQ
jgi:hypothetical protein